MSLGVRKSALTQVLSVAAKAAAVRKYRKQLLGLGLLLTLLAVSVGIAVMAPASATIPTFSVVDVVEDQTVTIRTANFPANQDFVVTMGPMGTRGINGTVVDTTSSGAGGSFEATYNIPAALRGSYQIAIRLQSAQGYYAYNWFYNNTTGDVTPAPTPGHVGIPRFYIESVVRDQTVTIRTDNFPENRDFVVTMGAMGTRGINGIPVATTNSGEGDVFTATYDIPAALHGSYQIAIRLQANTGGYFAYNWFYNNTTAGAGTGTGNGTGNGGTGGGADYTGIPTFSVESVVRDDSVTIETSNFPENRDFVVTMGAMGTRGINGIPVATTASGEGDVFTATYEIPAALQGSYRIAIRLQATSGGYYAYNWFYNSTTGASTPSTGTPATSPTPTPTPTPAPAPTDGFTGYPWFDVAGVQRDQSVTVNAYNLPPNQQFIVRMGAMGTRGINGIPVATTDSGAGGTLEGITYQIPDELAGSARIAIRMESAQGYYAYNWFYNSTTD